MIAKSRFVSISNFEWKLPLEKLLTSCLLIYNKIYAHICMYVYLWIFICAWSEFICKYIFTYILYNKFWRFYVFRAFYAAQLYLLAIQLYFFLKKIYTHIYKKCSVFLFFLYWTIKPFLRHLDLDWSSNASRCVWLARQVFSV